MTGWTPYSVPWLPRCVSRDLRYAPMSSELSKVLSVPLSRHLGALCVGHRYNSTLRYSPRSVGLAG